MATATNNHSALRTYVFVAVSFQVRFIAPGAGIGHVTSILHRTPLPGILLLYPRQPGAGYFFSALCYWLTEASAGWRVRAFCGLLCCQRKASPEAGSIQLSARIATAPGAPLAATCSIGAALTTASEKAPGSVPLKHSSGEVSTCFREI